MTASQFEVRLLQEVRRQINDTIDARSDVLVSGTASDYADYRFKSGEISGLTMALGIMEEIVRSMGDRRP